MLLMIAGTLKFLISYIFGHQGTVFGLWNACTLFLTCSTIISGQLGNMKVPRVHENPQKSDASIFSIVLTLGYMKIHKKRTLHFSPIFMTPGTWKSTKIRDFNFHVNENSQKLEALIFFNFHKNPQKSDVSIFFNFHDPGYMKIHRNQTLQLSCAWKSTKIRRFDFLQFS